MKWQGWENSWISILCSWPQTTNPEKWSSFILALSIYSETLWKSNPSRANSFFRKSNVVNLQNFWTFSKTFRLSCSLWRYEKNYKQSTMLQKLSKCEVKALLYWNLIILPPLRFYVKSNFVGFHRSKNVIFANFIDSELWIFGKFRT